VLVTLQSREWSAAQIEERLRNYSTPIITRAERNLVVLDLRTVAADEETVILEALRNLLNEKA
jgi:L-seryl-tRNA(Ser) seleniumtransferase